MIQTRWVAAKISTKNLSYFGEIRSLEPDLAAFIIDRQRAVDAMFAGSGHGLSTNPLT